MFGGKGRRLIRPARPPKTDAARGLNPYLSDNSRRGSRPTAWPVLGFKGRSDVESTDEIASRGREFSRATARLKLVADKVERWPSG